MTEDDDRTRSAHDHHTGRQAHEPREDGAFWLVSAPPHHLEERREPDAEDENSCVDASRVAAPIQGL
jgi:hypothetical protein